MQSCRKTIKIPVLTLLAVLLFLLSFQFFIQIRTPEIDPSPLYVTNITEAFSHPVNFIATNFSCILKLLFQGADGQNESFCRATSVRLLHPDPVSTLFLSQVIVYNEDSRPVLELETSCRLIRILSIPLGGHAPPQALIA